MTYWRAGDVDSRLQLLAAIGVEQRLGQVHNCRRTQLTLPRSIDPREQRGVEFAGLTIPGCGKKRTPVLEFIEGQLGDVVHAIGDTGYLRELEAAYQHGEIADYSLFPAERMPAGHAFLVEGEPESND